jgi:hypothetical protein
MDGSGCGGTTFGLFIVIPMSIAPVGVYSYHVEIRGPLALPCGASTAESAARRRSTPPGSTRTLRYKRRGPSGRQSKNISGQVETQCRRGA